MLVTTTKSAVTLAARAAAMRVDLMYMIAVV